MVPATPATFSTSTGCFTRSARRDMKTRAVTSTLPPVAKGTITLIAREG